MISKREYQSDTLYHLSETLKIIVLCLRDRSEFL